MQYSTAIRTARLAAIHAALGPSPKLLLFASPLPLDCSHPDPPNLLATLTLPTVWISDPVVSGNDVRISLVGGPWSGAASAAGAFQCFRFYDNGLTVCGFQGTITVDTGIGNMTFPTLVVSASEVININAFHIISGNTI